MKKINVVHITEDMKIGGLERLIAMYAERLNSEVFDVHVLTLNSKGPIYEELEKKRIKISCIEMKSSRDFFGFCRLIAYLKKNDIKVVHSHGHTADTIARLAALFAAVPVRLVHMHNTHWSFPFRVKLKDRILSAVTDRIICCSKAVENFVLEVESINKRYTQVIYNGININKYKFCKKKDIKARKFNIVCVASLNPHKGQELLIEAVSQLKDNIKDHVKLIIAGEGKQKEFLCNKAIECGISEIVELKGRVDDVPSLLKSSDLFILPSKEREGLPLSMIEAMASGLPVIGTDVGGVSEVIENEKNGFLIEPNNAIALQEAIEKIYKMDEDIMNSFCFRSRQIVEKLFNEDVMLRQTEDLYKECLFKKGFSYE